VAGAAKGIPHTYVRKVMRLTWVPRDDGNGSRAYRRQSALPVAEVTFHRWRSFPGGWHVTVEGDELSGSWTNEALARRAAEQVYWRRARERR
jgi:hypothetical protein